MPIPVACACGKKGKVPDEYAGKAIMCPACRRPIDVPGGTSHVAVVPVAQPAPVVFVQAPAPDPFPVQHEQRGFQCPYCKGRTPPIVYSKISAGGWVLFVLMLLFFVTILFCWVPLLFMKDEYRVCSSCGIKLG